MPRSPSPRRPPIDAGNRFKHLIFLFDGTWSSAAAGANRDITNVFHLNMAINADDQDGMPQIIFYSPGPGTRGKIDRGIGGLFGSGIDQIIKEAYVNLCSNYWPGDKIHILGYSRGAVAARALTGIISKCGILKVEEMGSFWEVWSHFLDRRYTPSNNLRSPTMIGNTWPNTPNVSFLGLFDTVLGRNYKEPNLFAKLRFHDNQIDSGVETAVQILSIDDNRKLFKPLLWDGKKNGRGTAEQIWIPGVHGDMGGLGDTFFGDVALITMIDRIIKKGDLDIDHDYVRNLLRELPSRHKIVSISNERRLAFLRAVQNISRYPSEQGVFQKIHAIYDVVSKTRIVIRGKAGTYWPKHEAFERLQRATTAYDRAFSEAFSKIRNQMIKDRVID